MRRETSLPLLWLVALTYLFVDSAFGGYRELRDALEGYRPPDYLFADAAAAPAAALTHRDDVKAFAAERDRITALKARWENVLQAPPKASIFYWPQAQVLDALGSAGTNLRASQRALRPTFSLATLEALTLLRNPGVKAAENRVRATLEQFGQVTTVNEILRQYTAFTEGIMTGVGPMKGKEPAAMTFPFPGVMALQGQVVTQDVLASMEELEMARRDAITAARQSHWRLWFTRQTQAVTAKTVDLLKDLESVAKTRYEAGNTSFQDVIKIQVKREILEEELRTLQEKRRNIEAELRELLYLPPDVQIGRPQVRLGTAKLPSLETLYHTALERRQELRHLRTRIGKMERMIEMAETMMLPSFSLGFSSYKDEAITQVGSTAKQPTFATSTTASTGAGLPIRPWFGAADAYLRELRQRRHALAEELKAAEAATITMVRKSWFALDQAQREQQLYQHHVSPLSQAALDVSTSGYESGNVSFADVIASYTLWLDTNLMLANRHSAYGISLAELEQAVGRSFVQHP
jgi:outer membrane protein TolC